MIVPVDLRFLGHHQHKFTRLTINIVTEIAVSPPQLSLFLIGLRCILRQALDDGNGFSDDTEALGVQVRDGQRIPRNLSWDWPGEYVGEPICPAGRGVLLKRREARGDVNLGSVENREFESTATRTPVCGSRKCCQAFLWFPDSKLSFSIRGPYSDQVSPLSREIMRCNVPVHFRQFLLPVPCESERTRDMTIPTPFRDV